MPKFKMEQPPQLGAYLRLPGMGPTSIIGGLSSHPKSAVALRKLTISGASAANRAEVLMTQSLPGWYPDPSDPSRQRYFDGKTWTENYAPFAATPAYAAQPAMPAKKQSKATWWIAGIGGALVLLVLIGSIGGTKDKKSTSTVERSTAAAPTRTLSPTSNAPAGPTATPAGNTVRDGKFEFEVLGTRRDGTTKEDSLNTERAKGEFFTVTLRVTNIGNEERSFMSSNQKLIIGGNEYEATSFLNSGMWIESINPGLGIQGDVTFDIPKGAVPTAIEVHDSAFSGGARLAL